MGDSVAPNAFCPAVLIVCINAANTVKPIHSIAVQSQNIFALESLREDSDLSVDISSANVVEELQVRIKKGN